MPLIIPANTISGDYEVANSLRFNRPSNDSLTKTFGSSGNRKTWSFSTWIKRSNLINANMNILGTDYTVSSGEAYLLFKAGEQLHYGQYESGGGANNFKFQTNQAFRDISAWYNILFVWDTTQSTSSDRMKLYVNGTQVTSFSSSTYPSLNLDGVWNNARTHYIGDAFYGTNLDGYLAETVFVDGTALSPTDVGEFDEDTGIWKPIDVSGLTFGNNGFYLDFENSGSLGADVSGNGNNFTVNNLTAIDQSTDTCTNNFAVLNNLVGASSSATYSDGNLTVAISSSKSLMSTIGVGSGKFYFETKINTVGSTYLGFCSERNTGTDFGSYRPLGESALVNQSSSVYDAGGNTGIDGIASISNNDIIGCALDVDNKKFWWSKNGQWYSANASSASTINISDVEAGNNGYDFSSWKGQFVFASFGTSTNANNISVNFGSPPYSESGGNSDANGYGNFAQSVPSGFYAMNSKNLAEYG